MYVLMVFGLLGWRHLKLEALPQQRFAVRPMLGRHQGRRHGTGIFEPFLQVFHVPDTWSITGAVVFADVARTPAFISVRVGIRSLGAELSDGLSPNSADRMCGAARRFFDFVG